MFGGFSNLCCPEKWSGLNRISPPDCVKICVDPNGQIKLRAKQKYEILSTTGPTLEFDKDTIRYIKYRYCEIFKNM